ncbi:DUF1385 domain-containing protein [Lachnospiraceae bacterium HCP1S3_C3]|nr:DUF1385 domain-containing protein [Lachnospiraceae bacterium]
MKPSGIGGQAVLEGIMMRNKDKYSVAVRKPDQTIALKVDEYKGLTSGKKIIGLPFIRGIFNFIDSMVLGIKTLAYSAEFYEEEEDVKESKMDKAVDKLFKEKAEDVIMGVTIFISIVIALGLFVVLPSVISDLLKNWFDIISVSVLSIIEGVIRIALFIIYILLISMMKDIKRTFMYHGAEHKCINCIENGMELNVENVMKSSRYHKRCGTSFIFMVMIISIIFFIFIRVGNPVLKIVVRLLLIPVIAGVSYEFIKLAGRSESKIVNILSKPGMLLQKITTSEPDEDMVEVAIEAVSAVFDWKEYLANYDKEESVKDDEDGKEES